MVFDFLHPKGLVCTMDQFELFDKQLALWDLHISNEQKELLSRYYELLVEYNQCMNLTAIIDWQDVCTKHFLDSAALLMKDVSLDLQNKTVIDIGTGAGFPGLVLKILKPDINLVLLDALTKRVRFLNTVIQELRLNISD